MRRACGQSSVSQHPAPARSSLVLSTASGVVEAWGGQLLAGGVRGAGGLRAHRAEGGWVRVHRGPVWPLADARCADARGAGGSQQTTI